MNRTFLIALILLCVIILLGVTVAQELRIANARATHSAAASIWSGLMHSKGKHTTTSSWSVLSDDEYDSTINGLIKSGISLDACRSCYTPDGIVADAWGERFLIAARKTEEGVQQYVILSKGPDGKLGTDDDVIAPSDKSTEASKIIAQSRERFSNGAND